MENDISKAAAALGRRGGASKSDAKRAASAANGRKGGRPPTTFELRDGQPVMTKHGGEMVAGIVHVVRSGMISIDLEDGTSIKVSV